MTDFGALLHQHRTAAGLSQVALAAAAGCDQTYIASLERGRRGQPSRPAVLALAQALDLSASRTDRLLRAAGHATQVDYQALWEREHGELDVRTKWCPRCKQPVYVSLFSEQPGRPDGLAGYCKPCKAAYTAEHQKKIALRAVGRAS